MSNFWDTLRHALRMFRRNPGFTFAAVAALAMGIGINTAIFTVVDAVLLKPLTYPDADRIIQFLITSPRGDGTGISIPDFVAFEQQTSIPQMTVPQAQVTAGMTALIARRSPVICVVRTRAEPHQFISAVSE
jgi:hypothetical protein